MGRAGRRWAPLQGYVSIVPFLQSFNTTPIDEKQIIDTQAPLLLPGEGFSPYKLHILLSMSKGDRILLQDLLAIHMYRTSTTSTIISYHPSGELQRTSAKRLQSLVQRTGDSVYWSKIFARSKDPTFLFLAILWYALYAWDEAFEVLYRYINTLVSNVVCLAFFFYIDACVGIRRPQVQRHKTHARATQVAGTPTVLSTTPSGLSRIRQFRQVHPQSSDERSCERRGACRLCRALASRS